MACDGYTKVWELAAGELIGLDGGRGTTLRVTRGHAVAHASSATRATSCSTPATRSPSTAAA